MPSARPVRAATRFPILAVVHENVLARDLAVGTASRAWTGDIPYRQTREGWLSRAAALDAPSAGFEVLLQKDAARGVDVQPRDSEKAVLEMKEKGVGVGRTGELE